MKCKYCERTDETRGFVKKYSLCFRHYMQIKRYGKILERTKRDPNKFIDNQDGTMLIEIYNINHEVKCCAIIDSDMYNLVKDIKWAANDKGYIVGHDKKTKQRILLHRLIMTEEIENNHNNEKLTDIDHIDGNPLNNRRSNLRLVTHQQNLQNQANSDGLNGVNKLKTCKRYQAKIKVNGVSINLGSFENIEDAIAARKDAEKKYFVQR